MSMWDYVPGGKMIDSFLNPDRGYKKGEDAINRSWEEAKGFMQPYANAGMNEYGRLSGATGNLLHPDQLENKWIQGYEMSPYAQDEIGRSKEYGLDAASSMGLMGSSPALESIQRNSSSIMNADRRNYLQDLMQKYLAGVQSSQNIFGIGAGTAQSMGQGALSTGENVAKMRYGAANAPGEMFAHLLGQFLNSQGGGGANAATTAATAAGGF